MQRRLAAGIFIALVVLGLWLSHAIQLAWPQAEPQTNANVASSRTRVASTTGEQRDDRGAIARAEATKREDAGAARLELRVRHVDGQPAPAADVWVWNSTAVEHAIADENGNVTLSAAPEAGGALVIAPNAVSVVKRFSSLTGTHEIIVGEGSALSVSFTLPTGMPVQDLEVRVKMRLDDLAIPEHVADSLADARPRNGVVNWVVSRTNDNGELCLTGLREGRRLILELPRETTFLMPDESPGFLPEEGNALAMATPLTGAVVVLERMPTARGRVVWDDGEPIPNASVSVHALIDGNTQTGIGVTSADGLFEVGVVRTNRHDLDDIAGLEVRWQCLDPPHAERVALDTAARLSRELEPRRLRPAAPSQALLPSDSPNRRAHRRSRSRRHEVRCTKRTRRKRVHLGRRSTPA